MAPELTNRINADVRKALADPGVLERLRNTGNTPLDMSPAEFAKFVRSEIGDYQRVARAAGIKPQ
jgi:tripartite-type tricarboxylate transporter receptor subunit TctC